MVCQSQKPGERRYRSLLLNAHPHDASCSASDTGCFSLPCREYLMVLSWVYELTARDGQFAPHNSTLDQFVDIITDSEPKLLLVGEATLYLAKEAASKCDCPQELIYMIESSDYDEFKSIWGIAGEEGEELEPTRLSPKEVKELVAFMCYSSGTTGKAKGGEYFGLRFSIKLSNLPMTPTVQSTHHNVTSVILQVTQGRKPSGADAPERIFCSKMEHTSGVVLCLFLARKFISLHMVFRRVILKVLPIDSVPRNPSVLLCRGQPTCVAWCRSEIPHHCGYLVNQYAMFNPDRFYSP